MKLNKYLNKANLKDWGVGLIMGFIYLLGLCIALSFEDVFVNIDVNIELIGYAVVVIVLILINRFKPKSRADIGLIVLSVIHIIYQLIRLIR